jgi:hypothetical protein
LTGIAALAPWHRMPTPESPQTPQGRSSRPGAAVSHRKITGQPVRRNIADTFSVDNPR